MAIIQKIGLEDWTNKINFALVNARARRKMKDCISPNLT